MGNGNVTIAQSRPGSKAQLRYARFSAYKAREVLNLVRGLPVAEATAILSLTERDAAIPIGKLLDSAIANAVNNEEIPEEQLFVSECWADEGPTLKRFRPRAQGRASRIRKRTTHITIMVSRFSADELELHKLRRSSSSARPDAASARAQRVAKSRAAAAEAKAEAAELEEAEQEETNAAEEAVETETVETETAVAESEEIETEAVAKEEASDDTDSADEAEGDS